MRCGFQVQLVKAASLDRRGEAAISSRGTLILERTNSMPTESSPSKCFSPSSSRHSRSNPRRRQYEGSGKKPSSSVSAESVESTPASPISVPLLPPLKPIKPQTIVETNMPSRSPKKSKSRPTAITIPTVRPEAKVPTPQQSEISHLPMQNVFCNDWIG